MGTGCRGGGGGAFGGVSGGATGEGGTAGGVGGEGGGRGTGEGGGYSTRGPQSMQSSPKKHDVNSEPTPPSSHVASDENWHVSSHLVDGDGGGGGGGVGDGDVGGGGGDSGGGGAKPESGAGGSGGGGDAGAEGGAEGGDVGGGAAGSGGAGGGGAGGGGDCGEVARLQKSEKRCRMLSKSVPRKECCSTGLLAMKLRVSTDASPMPTAKSVMPVSVSC